MKRTSTTLAAALSAGALVLAGCTIDVEQPSQGSSGVEQATSAPVETVSDAPTSPTSSGATAPAATGQDWADQKVAQWWDAEGAENFSDFYHPFNLIEFWKAGDEGEVVFTVDPAITETDEVYLNNEGPANDVWMIAAVMWDQLDREGNASDLESIEVRTADGERTELFTREDQYGPTASGDHDPASQEWADEMVDLWLEAEGVETVNGLLDPFNLIESWEATGSGELTLYADPAILNDPTHTEPGPGVLHGITALVWQRLYCGAPELESVTVATTDGQDSKTTPREDWSPSRQLYGNECRT